MRDIKLGYYRYYNKGRNYEPMIIEINDSRSTRKNSNSGYYDVISYNRGEIQFFLWSPLRDNNNIYIATCTHLNTAPISFDQSMTIRF